MYKTLGGKPVKKLMATHWARLIELLFAAERLLELAQDPEVASTNIRTISNGYARGRRWNCGSAAQDSTHHYKTDKNGLVTEANLIVGTTNNHAPISMAIKRAARS